MNFNYYELAPIYYSLGSPSFQTTLCVTSFASRKNKPECGT